VEYNSEAFTYFEQLMNDVRLQICRSLFQRSDAPMGGAESVFLTLSRNATLQGPDGSTAAPVARVPGRPGSTTTAAPAPTPVLPDTPAEEIQLPKVTIRREMPKVGRNDPCPCGSGKKFKNCHGKM
jgi:preprotein translocase subunit SecA